MSRKRARELAFKILFQADVGRNPWQEVLPRTLAETNLPEKSSEFLGSTVKGTVAHLKEIDAIITKYAVDWRLDRMANTDRNILRLAVHELLYMPEIPASVTASEAVELAKRYGDDESGRFVNGILGNVVRQMVPDKAGADKVAETP
ncbi:MAG: transcription antitermination factor NusB [Bacteroidota bacterium]